MLSPLSSAALSAGIAPASGQFAKVQPARSVSAPSLQSSAQLAPAVTSPPTRAAPDRVLPRGSLLDLSV